MRFMVSLGLVLLVFILVACGSINENNKDVQEFAGIVVEKKQKKNQILVVPNTREEEIANKTKKELTAIALERKGAYYSVSSSEYDDVEVGTQVIVHWDKNKGQEDSAIPQRESESVEIGSDD